MISLKKNILYSFTYQMLIIILPFITTPYLSRVIGADGIGTYTYSYTIALYFVNFTLLGLNQYGLRAIAGISGGISERSQMFSEIRLMQTVSFLICVIFYIAYILLFAPDKPVAMIQALFVLSALFDINWFFGGIEQFKLTVIRNSIIKAIVVICIFIFVKTEKDLNKYIFIMSSGFLLTQLCIWPFLKNFLEPCRIPMRNILKDVSQHIKPNLILYLPVIAINIYRTMNKMMLGMMGTMAYVGFYENAEKIVNVPIALIASVGAVMLPRMSAMMSKNQEDWKKYIDKAVIVLLMFGNASAFGIMAVAHDFTILYCGEGFEKTSDVMPFLAITILFYAIGNVVRTQYLIPMKKDNIYLTSAIMGAVINIIVNLLLIPRMDVIGAAIGTVVAEFIVCFYQIFMVRKELNLKLYFYNELIFLSFALIMFAGIKLLSLSELMKNINIVVLMVKIGVGIIIYGVLSFLYLGKTGILKKWYLN